MVHAGVSDAVTVSNYKSTLRSKFYEEKISQKSAVLCTKFAVISQWTVVRFLVGLIVFVVVV